jgi:hypothetical protein
MPSRLDRQKHTRKPHRRFNSRFYVRGYDVRPHDVWGDWGENRATGATAGTPGSFTPGGSETPRTIAQLRAWGVVASPTSTWTVGQRVVLGDGSTAHWHTSNGWVAGNAP